MSQGTFNGDTLPTGTLKGLYHRDALSSNALPTGTLNRDSSSKTLSRVLPWWSADDSGLLTILEWADCSPWWVLRTAAFWWYLSEQTALFDGVLMTAAFWRFLSELTTLPDPLEGIDQFCTTSWRFRPVAVCTSSLYLIRRYVLRGILLFQKQVLARITYWAEMYCTEYIYNWAFNWNTDTNSGLQVKKGKSK